jgi:eukaryotic-like serine/threonine-protein kinase
MTSREKYSIVRKIDSGGMAEVFLGTAEGIQGFSKKVAIKRVLPQFVENKKFLAMFLDEARISLRLNHANIVHVFDIGQAGGTYFIVMEFVDGTNLKKLMAWMREHGTRMPLPLAIHIVLEICRGLAYAHELTDAEGRNLRLVHRDVSPPNILLSRQGEVKLVDFGLAKATSQIEHTDPGVVKGKFAYLAPEAAWGKEVDHRADIFACGIILFELIAGKRLFLGETDIQTVELVRLTEIPSVVDINHEVKPALEAIVRKSLSQDRESRYQSCSEMAEDLASYLFSQQLKVTGFDLRRFIEHFVVEEERVRERESHRPSIIDQLIQEEIARFASLEDGTSELGSGLTDFPGGGGARAGGVPLNPYRFDDVFDEPSSGSPDGALVPPEDGIGAALEPLDDHGGAPQRRVSRPAAAWQERGSEDNPVSLAQMLEGEVRLGAEMLPGEESTGGRGFWVGVAIALGTAAIVFGVLFALGIVP